MATLLVADSREIFLAGLEGVLQRAGHNPVACCHLPDDFFNRLQQFHPHVVILAGDFTDGYLGSPLWQETSRIEAPPTIIMLRDTAGRTARKFQSLGAAALIDEASSHAQLLACVSTVAATQQWTRPPGHRHSALPESPPGAAFKLTERESEIADLVIRGLRNKAIGRQLGISDGTVKMHLHHIYAKMHLRSRAELTWAEIGGPATHAVHSGMR